MQVLSDVIYSQAVTNKMKMRISNVLFAGKLIVLAHYYAFH